MRLPWVVVANGAYPEGVPSGHFERLGNPFRVEVSMGFVPRVAAVAATLGYET
jgi:hypothetical protein